jgi:hypothetical protein
MSKEGKKTAIFAGIAAVLVLLAVVSSPRPRAAAEFRSQGEEFYPAFKDPLKAAALEVIDYDELAGTPKPFKVQVVNGMWSIPSHHNYPADGKDRLAKTAASVMDLKKERIASDNVKDHEEFGVVDPLDPAAKGTRGRGKRVRLFDASGSTLADYVFGKDTKEGGGHRYVRVPDQKQTFAVKVTPEISVKFEDWVETDLLKIGSVSVKKVTIDRYSFNLNEPAPKNRSTDFLSRDDSAAPWKLNQLKDNEEVNSDTINTLTSTLSGLKLTGVRPKPAQVAKVKDLNELSKIPLQTLRAAAQSMFQHGFYIMSENNHFSVVSSEGEEEVACDDGVVYRLLFGEALVGSAEEVSAGAEEKKDEKKDPKDKKPEGGSENRYLFVSVRYDDSLVGPAPVEPKPYVADPAKKPEEQKADEEKAKKDKEEYESKKKDLEKKKEDGKKRAEQLTTRFGEWYYVISADAFKKLRAERAQLVKAKEAPKDEKKPEAPKKEEPKKEEPKKDEPKKEEPKKEEPKKDEPKKN